MSAWIRETGLPTKIKGMGRWFDRDLGSVTPLFWLNESNPGFAVQGNAVDNSYNSYAVGGSAGVAVNITKFANNGTVTWQKEFTTGVKVLNDATVSTLNNRLIVCGESTLNGAFLCALNTSDGSLVFQKTFGIAGYVFTAVVTDSSGNIYVNGRTTANFPILLKLDSSGAIVWQKQYTGGTATNGQLCIDNAGNLYVATNPIVKFDNSGVGVWSITYTDPSSVGGLAAYLTCSSAGDVFINGQINNPGTGSIFAKFNTAGTFQFAVETVNMVSAAIQVDATNNIYATETDYSLGTAGKIIKMNSVGAVQWARNITDSIGGGSSSWYMLKLQGNALIGPQTNPIAGGGAMLSKLNTNGAFTGSYVGALGTFLISSATVTMSASSSANWALGGISSSILAQSFTTSTFTYSSVSRAFNKVALP